MVCMALAHSAGPERREIAEAKAAPNDKPVYTLVPPEALYLFPSDTKIDPDFFAKAIENMEIEAKSLELLQKGPEGQRYAVVGIVRKVGKYDRPKVELFFRPGFPSDATEADFKSAATKFGNQKYRRYFVQAIKGRPGVVHAKTISKIINLNPELENLDHRWHIDGAKAFTLGFSVYKTENGYVWLNRSTKNRKIFLKDPLALACFAFGKHVIEPSASHRYLRTLNVEYDNYFNIDRAIQIDFFRKLTTKAAQIINTKLTIPLPSIVNLNECFSSIDESNWSEIWGLPAAARQAKIQTLLMNNVYIHLLGYGSKKYFEKTEEVLIQGFEEAKRNNIHIDIEHIPNGFSQNALVFAASKGKLKFVKYFLDQTKPEKKAKIIKDALFAAANNGQYEMVKFLMAIHSQPLARHDEAKIPEEQKNVLTFFKCFEDPNADIRPYLINGINLGEYRQLICELAFLESVKRKQLDRVALFRDQINEDLLKKALKEAIKQNNSDMILQLMDLAAESIRKTLTSYGLLTAAECYLADEKAYDISNVMMYLNEGADIDYKDAEGNTTLMNAVESGRIDLVRLLIEKKADVNVRNSKGLSPLMIAAEVGDQTIAKTLIANQAELEAKDAKKQTPLYKAVLHDNSELVKMFAMLNADCYAPDDWGESPFSLAAKIHNLDMFKNMMLQQFFASSSVYGDQACSFIQEHKEDRCDTFLLSVINTFIERGYNDLVGHFFKDPNTINSLFSVLSWEKFVKIVKVLVERNIIPHDYIPELLNTSLGLEKNSALSLAVYFEDMNTVKLFVEHKADITARDSSGCSALMRSLMTKSTELTDYFSSLNPNYFTQLTELKDSVFHIAAKYEKTDFIKKYIDAYPQFINHRNADNETLLDIAVKTNNTELFQFLLARKAEFGSFPYPDAATFERLDMIKTMVEHEAKQLEAKQVFINQRNDDNMTALDIAVISNNSDLFQFLLEKKAEFSIFPLPQAASNKRWDMIATMVNHGGDLLSKDEDDDTCASLIVSSHPDFVNYLSEMLVTFPSQAKEPDFDLKFMGMRTQLMQIQWDPDKKTLLHFAAEQKNSVAFVNFFRFGGGGGVHVKDATGNTPLDYAKAKFAPEQYAALLSTLGIKPILFEINTELIQHLIAPDSKDAKCQVQVPDGSNIDYKELKRVFMEYVKTLEPSSIRNLMEQINREENLLGVILRDEPKPPPSLLNPPTTLQQMAKEVEELLTPKPIVLNDSRFDVR